MSCHVPRSHRNRDRNPRGLIPQHSLVTTALCCLSVYLENSKSGYSKESGEYELGFENCKGWGMSREKKWSR